MSKRVTLMTAATLAAGAWAFVSYDTAVLAQDKDREVSGKVEVGGARAGVKMELPAGITRSDRTDEAGIRRALGGAVEAVMQDDSFSFSDLTPYIASNDRARFTSDRGENDKLNQKIRQLRAAFKDKYNQDFDIREELVFGEQFRGMEIVQGEVSNPALLSNWPVEAKTSTGSGGSDVKVRTEVRTGSDQGAHKAEPDGPGSPGTLKDKETVRQTTTVDREGSTAGRDKAEPDAPGSPGTLREDRGVAAGEATATKTTLDRGMNVAVVTFPQSHDAPEFNVSLLREGGAAGARAGAEVDVDRREAGAAARADLASSDWRIDVPTGMTADQLQMNLAKHIDEALSMKDRWPADANEAYRAISHHVLYAFYDSGASARVGGTIDRTGAGRDRGGDKAEPSGPGSPGTLKENR